MDTAKFNCGHCGKAMAVSTEHVGGEVRCPHCQQIVRPQEPTYPHDEERESILSSSEVSDDMPAASSTHHQPENQHGSHGWEGVAQSESTVSVPPRRASRLGPTLLMILIPYSIISTALIAWLIYNQRRSQPEPLERIPAPKDVGSKRRAQDTKPAPQPRAELSKDLATDHLQKITLALGLAGTHEQLVTPREQYTSGLV